MVNINDILNPNTMQVQTFVNYVIWILAGLIIAAFMGYFFYKLWKKAQYNIHVTIHRHVGKIAVKQVDWAKKITDNDGNYFFHYLNINKKSPIVKDEFLKIVKGKTMGIFKKSNLGFDAYFIDGKVIPMQTNKVFEYNKEGKLEMSHVSLTGIDYDEFNFLQKQIEANRNKRMKVDKLFQILPIIGLFLVVIAFIAASALYGQHIENVAKTILGYAQQQAQTTLESGGVIQKLTGK